MMQQQSVGRREAPEAMTQAMVDAAAQAARGAAAGGAVAGAAPTAGAPAARDPVDWWTERLVDACELEAAVVDALSPERDGLPGAAGPLRRLSLAAARGLAVANRAADPRTAAQQEWGAAALARAHARLAAAAHLAAVAVREAGAALGDEIPVPVPRGFADGGLYPEMYAAAARQLAARVGPPRTLVVGVRGTGAGLSAVVADTLARRGVEVRSVTIRAAGPSDDGSLALDAALDAMLRDAAAAPGAWAAVVDEGPDAAGSSFTAAAAALAERGFDASRIVFFPSWTLGDAATGSGAPTPHPRPFVASFDDVVLTAGGVRCHRSEPDCRLEELADVARAAGSPRLGARTFLCAADHGGDGPVRLTFAGLGRYGQARADAAERLAATGGGPRVLGLRHGFLVTAEPAGRPRTVPGAPDPGGV